MMEHHVGATEDSWSTQEWVCGLVQAVLVRPRMRVPAPFDRPHCFHQRLERQWQAAQAHGASSAVLRP
jgi:hypothetical protein